MRKDDEAGCPRSPKDEWEDLARIVLMNDECIGRPRWLDNNGSGCQLGANFCLLTSLSFVCRGQGGELAATRSARIRGRVQVVAFGNLDGPSAPTPAATIETRQIPLLMPRVLRDQKGMTAVISFLRAFAGKREESWRATFLFFLFFWNAPTPSSPRSHPPSPDSRRQSAFFFLSTSVSLG